MVCDHNPSCPPADRTDREAAKPVLQCPEQGWHILCNDVLVFDDTGALLPGGEVVPAHRPQSAPLTGQPSQAA